ncbi:MAG: hypothetical protein Q7S52_04665, partial [bacterium]|nr:hypothetical protein [bacterium]
EAKAKMPWEAVHIVESPGGKVPINSLSTLLQNPALAEDYARRNFSDHQGFLEVLLEIKQSA